MRLKMASAVEGCLYKRLNVVPGRPSKYSRDRREDTDIFSTEELDLHFGVAEFTCLSWLKSCSVEMEKGLSHFKLQAEIPGCYPTLGSILESLPSTI